MINYEPRQARKGATVIAISGAGVWLVRLPPISMWSLFSRELPTNSKLGREMAYQVFARKFRPKSFASLKGQEHVTRALVNAISRGELHHAYLFTGTRGVGKTSVARILAKCLNCERGISATPCGECNACVNIDAGRFIDLIEVDAASRTRVEDTRELLENVQYAPTSGRFKIYLIDEVHMLSTHSFNALLKTLEEPPAHVKFILATTDPERIPVTVLSRCLRFMLKPLTDAEIVVQLKDILSIENIKFEERGLQSLAKVASGSMRDALSLLEQANAYGNGELKTHMIEEMLGLGYQRYLPDLLRALEANDVTQCLTIVQEMAMIGADFEQSLATILQILHALAIAQAVKSEEIATFAELTPEEFALKDKFSPQAVQLLYQIALIGKRDLNLAPTLRTGFEMILLRMMAFRPKETDTVPAIMNKTQVAAPLSVQAPVPVPTVAPKQASEAISQTPVPTAAPFAPQGQAPTINNNALDWITLIPKLSLSGLTLVLVKNCVLTKWDGNVMELTLDAQQKAFLNASRQAQIQEALRQVLANPLKLNIVVGEVGALSPSKVEEAQAIQKEQNAKASIEQDNVVKNILSTFDATVEKITVKDT